MDVPFNEGKADMITALKRVRVTVDDMEATEARLDEASQHFNRVRLRHKIEGDVGSVVVNGYGSLVKVELEATRVASTGTQVLSQRIVAAINHAESLAETWRRSRIAEIVK